MSVCAKVVLKPTTEHLARNSGIPELINLTSFDEAILETIYDGREETNISKLIVCKTGDFFYSVSFVSLLP